MKKSIYKVINKIDGLNEEAMKEAKKRQDSLAKPPGSLGKLEDISIQLAGITGKVINNIDKKCIIIMSADNGVVEEGVSSAPQSVTIAQTINFHRKLTGVGTLSKSMGCDLMIVDVGINGDIPIGILTKEPSQMKEKIIDRKIAYGTKNIAKEDAMSYEEAIKSIEIGIEMADNAKNMGYDIIGIGEMGIGNTTTSAAVLGALLGLSAEEVAGRGGGINDTSFAKKKEIISRIINRDFNDEIDIIRKIGGFDIGAMTGVFLGGAKNKMPIVIDGFISVVAALLASKIAPDAKHYMIASHRSFETGYAKAIEALDLQPMLELGMRLGEGSGCALGFKIIEGACSIMSHMATFEEASIDDKYLDEIRKGECF